MRLRCVLFLPQGLIFSSIGSWLRSGPYHDEEIDLELDDRDRDAGDDGRSFPMHSVPTVDGLGFGPDAGNGHDSRLSEMVEDYRRSRAAESASAPGPASCSPRGRETREQQPLAYGAMGQELLSLMVLLQRQLEEQGRMDADMTFDASSWKIKLLRLLVIPQSCPGQAHQAARTCDSDCDLLRLLWGDVISCIASDQVSAEFRATSSEELLDKLSQHCRDCRGIDPLRTRLEGFFDLLFDSDSHTTDV